jgi:hypothetical protein
LDDPLGDEVRCYSGSSFAERPQAFIWQGQEYSVEKILSTALTPDRKKFTVRTESSEIFLLEYILDKNQWFISLLEQI